MRRRNFREKTQPQVMIIPMIDIMLFLLVFFMLSTLYMVQTNNFQVNLPQSKTRMQENPQNPISVTIMKNGEILYDGTTVLEKNLPVLITHALSKDKNAVFVIYGDRKVQYEKVVRILDILKKAGGRNVSIATELKK